MNLPLHLKIRVISWSLTTPYGARPGIGRCYHTRRRPAPVRYVTTQEKILKIVRCPGNYQIRRWCANRWNRTMSVLFLTIALDKQPRCYWSWSLMVMKDVIPSTPPPQRISGPRKIRSMISENHKMYNNNMMEYGATVYLSDLPRPAQTFNSCM